MTDCERIAMHYKSKFQSQKDVDDWTSHATGHMGISKPKQKQPLNAQNGHIES